MTSRVEDVFFALCEQLQIPLPEVRLLRASQILTADEFFFRLPSNDKLEEWVSDTLRIRTTEVRPDIDGEDAIAIVPRIDATSGHAIEDREFSRSALAASFRRLWSASKAAAQRDMNKAAEDAQFGAPGRVNAAVLADLAQKALQRGVGAYEAHERPGQATVTRVMENFKHSGPWMYLPWEVFVSEDEENHHRRLRGDGKTPRFKLELTTEGSLRGVADENDLTRVKVTDVLAMQDCLRVRAVTHAWLSLVDIDVYERLTRLYVARYRKRMPERMRGPTLGEVRQTDRVLHEEILLFAARGSGTLMQGLEWYLDHTGDKIWQLLEGQCEEVPDLSIEQPIKRLRVADADSQSSSKCLVCGKARKDHPNRSFCRLPGKGQAPTSPGQTAAAEQQGWQQRTFDRGTDKGKKGRGGGGRGKGGRKGKDKKGKDSTPSWLAGCAQRTPPSARFPGGQAFCWAFHNPNQQGCEGNCGRSHKCPKFVDDHVCMAAHAVYNH